MKCGLSWHRGGRRVFRSRIVYLPNGKKVEGCISCTDGLLTQIYPAEKRWVMGPSSGKSYKMSAAHRRDIKLRRVCPDLSHVWYDKNGLGSRCNITNSREYKGAPSGPPQNWGSLAARDFRGKPA